MKRTKIIVLLIIIAIVLAGSFAGYKYYKYIFRDNISLKNNSEKIFFISENANFKTVKDSLQKYLLNISSFEWVAKKKNYPNLIKPGRYQLKENMSNNELINMLRAGKQKPVKLTFNNIRTLNELSKEVSGYIQPDSAEISKYLNDPETAKKYGFNKHSFPAMFIPNTYEIYWNSSPPEFTDRMKKEYDTFWNRKRLKKAKEINLSPVKVSTLASIIEKETRVDKELPVIAGVYINRLKKGMFLQACPTLIYASGDFDKHRVLDKDKKIESPYNTYKFKGLPPGPICLPSIKSIDAVLNYKEHNYYYFCAKPDNTGSHHFSRNYSQHLQYAKQYQRFLNKSRIYN